MPKLTSLPKGRNIPFGSNHKMAKLTESKVKEIRKAYGLGVTQVRIAEELGISQQNVSHICVGRSWKHVK